MKKLLLGFAACMLLPSCRHQPLVTVEQVDVKRYMGKWYEIASIPKSFQEGCRCTTAEYSLNSDGTVKVYNSCEVDGKKKDATGIAKVTDKETNARLKVSFFRPFYGKYWIIELADDYSYAAVGHPDRNSLWILSRTPEMEPGVYHALLEKVAQKGFDTTKLTTTVQNCDK